METCKIQDGIWELEITLYRSGNIWIKRTNKVTKETFMRVLLGKTLNLMKEIKYIA